MRRVQPILIAVLFLGGVFFTHDAPNASDRPGSILSLYRFTPKNEATLKKVAHAFEIEHRKGESFEVLVPIEKSAQFLALVPDAELLKADEGAAVRNLSRSQLRGYHDFNSMQAHLRRIVFANPSIAKIEQYGTSQEGRPLIALKVSDRVDDEQSEPALMITAATHGDEIITVEVLMGLLDNIIDGYNNHDPRFQKMVEQHVLYFIPVVNPDGYVRKERYSNGVDPNRDYPWPQEPTRSSNECIKGVMDFFAKHDIKGSMDFHASGRLTMYPWAYTHSSIPSADRKVFDDLTRQMSSFNHYTYGPIADVIYVAEGSSADYYYWKNKTLALGIEIGDDKSPSSGQIEAHVGQMRDSAWTFIEHF